tara:strand:- start:338 stop:1243 length:906 start_codon:yes stop_codon:yes gene_type:complete
MKEVSIIIINYNTSEYTLKCVASVLELTNPSITIEVIIVDNNSKIDDFKFLKQNLPELAQISLHRSVINLGFGGGNMFGAQFANSNYLLFLNNDAFLQNDCVSILLKYMNSHPDVGVSTAQNYDIKNEYVCSFDHNKGLRKLIFGRGFLEKFKPAEFPKRNKTYLKPLDVNFVNGAFMFFRTGVFSKVGGFDTSIFLYFEEMDICHRLLNIGYKSVLVPDAKINHYQGASTGTSKVISKEALISYFYVIKKNYSFLKYKSIQFYFLATFLMKPKKWYLMSIVWKGGDLPASLKQKQSLNYI